MKRPQSLISAFVILLSTIELSGCFLGSDDTGTSSIRTSNITLSSPLELTKEEFLESLNEIDEFTHSDDDNILFDESVDEEDEFDKCLTDNFKNAKFVAGTTQGVKLDSDFADAKNCFLLTFADVDITRLDLSILMDNLIFTDQSGNVVSVINQPVTSALNLLIKEGNLRMWFVLKTTIPDDQKTYFLNMKAAFSQNHIDGIELPCNYENPINNCRSTSVLDSISDIPGFPSGQDGYMLIANNIYYTMGQPYYYDGTVDFTVNDWTGVMQYGSTASNAPTYTASNGTESFSDTLQTTVLTKPSVRVQALNTTFNGSISDRIKSFVSETIKNADRN